VLDAGVRAANNYAKGFLMGPQNEVQKKKRQVSSEKRANGQGSIYYVSTKTGKHSYKAAIHDINGKRRVKTFKKKSDAEDWLSEQKRARQQGETTYATNPKMTVSEFLYGWVEAQYGDDQASTKRFYSNAIKNHIAPAIGNMKAANLSPKAIEGLLRDMVARKLKKGTLNSVKATLSAAYNDAVRLGDMVRNPMKSVKVPNAMSSSTKAIPREDWEKLYKTAMADPFSHARVEIGGIIGIRPGEARGLMWSDLNLAEKTLLIERQAQRVKGRGIILKAVKQKESRLIPLSDETIKILLNHQRHQKLQKAMWHDDHNLVFPNSVGKLMDEKADRAWFKQLCRNAWVPDYQLYQLRKTAFTTMASQTDVRTLMDYSGHTNVNTVMKSYVSSNNESMKKAVNGLDKLRPN
jgi:integrase